MIGRPGSNRSTQKTSWCAQIFAQTFYDLFNTHINLDMTTLQFLRFYRYGLFKTAVIDRHYRIRGY
jgi:hypothetical protein